MSKFENSSKLVVLIGDQSAGSEWVHREIDTVYKLKNLFPVKTGGNGFVRWG